MAVTVGWGRKRALRISFAAVVICLEMMSSAALFSARAGLFHYPWCETIRARCYAKALVRKAECNWRFAYAKSHRVDTLSKWPSGKSNYCYINPEDQKN
jgi:hypothetical protein